MQGKQLAERIGITPQSLSEIERSEAIGSVSIKTMRRVAEAMDCEFVYALVPRTSLDEMVRRQAGALAKDRLSRASHSMALEGQALDAGENQSILSRMTDQIADESPQSLWDKKL
jgi:predicted DNA-binding mobile mystery protein A